MGIGGKTIDLLTIKVGADIDETLKGFDEIKSKVGSFASGFTAAAAAATAVGAAMVGAAVKTGQWADELLDLRDQTNLSLRELQEFRAVSIQAGVGADTIADAVLKLQTRMASGAEGSADLRLGLEQLGVSLTDANGNSRDMGDVMTEVIGKLGDMEDVTQRNVTATKIFGRGATELMPVLGMTSHELQGAIDRAERLGIIMSDEDVEAADAFRKELDFLKESVTAGGREITMVFMPALTGMATWLSETGVPGVKDFAKAFEILGADAAVAVARIELEFAKLEEGGGFKNGVVGLLGLDAGPGLGGAGLLDPLGLDLLSKAVGADLGKSVEQAEANLARVTAAAEEVKLGIMGVGTGATETAASLRATMAPAFIEVTDRLIEFQTMLDPTSFAIDKTNFAQQRYNEVMEYGKEVTRGLMTAEELLAEEKLRYQYLVEVGAMTQEMATRGIERATAALNEQANAAQKDASAISELSGAWGEMSSILGAFGVSLPFIGPALGLFSRYAGGFAEGGMIPGGQWGIVGENGPEIVSGPANVSPMGGGASFVINVPPAHDPITLARDRQWMGAFHEMLDEARHQGFRF